MQLKCPIKSNDANINNAKNPYPHIKYQVCVLCNCINYPNKLFDDMSALARIRLLFRFAEFEAGPAVAGADAEELEFVVLCLFEEHIDIVLVEAAE